MQCRTSFRVYRGCHTPIIGEMQPRHYISYDAKALSEILSGDSQHLTSFLYNVVTLEDSQRESVELDSFGN